jgi:transcriptional regulator GlxA family with amidase domain
VALGRKKLVAHRQATQEFRIMDRRVKAAIEIMHRNPHCRLELLELAHQVNLSPSRFSHLFKTETSLSPKQYSYEWRVQKAKELLDRTFLKVSEISARLGYKHTGDLSRAFTKFYGYPPSLSRRESRSMCQPSYEESTDQMESAGKQTNELIHQATKQSPETGIAAAAAKKSADALTD